MRKLTPQDAPRIVEFLFEYFIENQRIAPLDVCMDLIQVRRFAEHALTHPDCIGYIDENGVILGELAETWFGPNKVGRGLLWYVRPRVRGGLLAWRLLRAFTQEAAARGAKYAKQDLDNPVNRRIAEGLFFKAGYKSYSGSYLKELH